MFRAVVTSVRFCISHQITGDWDVVFTFVLNNISVVFRIGLCYGKYRGSSAVDLFAFRNLGFSDVSVLGLFSFNGSFQDSFTLGDRFVTWLLFEVIHMSGF